MNNIIAFRQECFDQINALLKNKALILLWGKSGSGKSVLLQRLALYHNEDFTNEIFTDEKDFHHFIQDKKRKIIILDEVGMYSPNVLELIRIYSDEMSFVLSSHKKINLFEEEYFKSRFSAIFWLQKPDINELSNYIKMKFNQDFPQKSLKFLMKIYQGNLRYLDKILQSFCELNTYLNNKKKSRLYFKTKRIRAGIFKMNIEERVRELEDKYKRYLLKKYFKFLFIFAILIACMLISFFMVQDFYKQKALALEALEYKKTLNWQITQAQIANEKNKILQERLSKDESKDELEEELKTQIDIYSKILNISDLKRSFYQNPSYQKAMNLATQYYENKDYEKSIFWSLKANDIDRKNSDSWVLFAKAKQALGKDEEAKQALDTYVSYYGLIEFDKEIDD